MKMIENASYWDFSRENKSYFALFFLFLKKICATRGSFQPEYPPVPFYKIRQSSRKQKFFNKIR